MTNRQPTKGSDARTPARNVVIPDDDWEWLGDYAAGHGLDRGGVLRRLLASLREPPARVPRKHLEAAVMLQDDPVAQRRMDNLARRHQS